MSEILLQYKSTQVEPAEHAALVQYINVVLSVNSPTSLLRDLLTQIAGGTYHDTVRRHLLDAISKYDIRAFSGVLKGILQLCQPGSPVDDRLIRDSLTYLIHEPKNLNKILMVTPALVGKIANYVPRDKLRYVNWGYWSDDTLKSELLTAAGFKSHELAGYHCGWARVSCCRECRAYRGL